MCTNGKYQNTAFYGKLVDTYGNKFSVPEYSFKELYNAIPPHCFEKSATKGFAYIVRDSFCILVTFYLSSKYIPMVPSCLVRILLWALYTFIQGLFGIGLWVMGHECGHQAFSDSRRLNDATGWVIHSFLLVPYFSWKLSHKQHHALHNNLVKDLQFVPKSREDYACHYGKANRWEFTEDTPIWTAATLIGQQLLGWPYYLLTHDSGTDYPAISAGERGKGKRVGIGGGINHFDPKSPLFRENESHLILLSDMGLAITISWLIYFGYIHGWFNVFVWYGIPYLWVNHWLGIFLHSFNSSYLTVFPSVAIAYLQHTDPALPHYQPEAWNYMREAAATMDRDFGFIGRYVFHDIVETHVLHHTVSSIPFYHAREATEGIKKVMGEHYRCDTRGGAWGFLKSMWRSARWCQWAEECEGA